MERDIIGISKKPRIIRRDADLGIPKRYTLCIFRYTLAICTKPFDNR